MRVAHVHARLRTLTHARARVLHGAGFAVQLRTLAMNAVFIAGAANIQAMDLTGTAAAAHTITTQFWSLGGTVLLALSTVAAILVPRAVAASAKAGNMLEAQTSADRLLVWGLIVGVALAGLQMAMLPMIQVPLPSAIPPRTCTRRCAWTSRTRSRMRALTSAAPSLRPNSECYALIHSPSLCHYDGHGPRVRVVVGERAMSVCLDRLLCCVCVVCVCACVCVCVRAHTHTHTHTHNTHTTHTYADAIHTHIHINGRNSR